MSVRSNVDHAWSSLTISRMFGRCPDCPGAAEPDACTVDGAGPLAAFDPPPVHAAAVSTIANRAAAAASGRRRIAVRPRADLPDAPAPPAGQQQHAHRAGDRDAGDAEGDVVGALRA